MEKHNIGQNPDGNICYLQEYNPYKEKKVDIETQTTSSSYIRLQNDDIYITSDDFQRALELERYSRFIKLVCMFDGTLTILNAIMYNPYFAFVGLIYYCGYQGANQYNRTYLNIYITYEVLELIGKIYILAQIMMQKYAFVLGISVMIDVYILRIYNKFRQMLPDVQIFV